MGGTVRRTGGMEFEINPVRSCPSRARLYALRGNRRRGCPILQQMRVHSPAGVRSPDSERWAGRPRCDAGEPGRVPRPESRVFPSALRSRHASDVVRGSARIRAGGDGSHGAAAEREVLRALPHRHIESRGVLPRMPATAAGVRRGGRKGRRTGAMVRIARDRVSTLFALATDEATGGHSELADRYVVLARRIGMRYNVRLPTAYRDVYCRGCSAYWIEGRTVRTRLRSGHRVRTCLRCGRERRTRLERGSTGPRSSGATDPFPATRRGEATGEVRTGEDAEVGDDEETEGP